MKVRYDFSMDDAVAFAQYHNSHSPSIRRLRVLLVLLLVVVPFAILPFVVPAEARLVAAVVSVIVVPGILFRMPASFARADERRMRKTYGGAANEHLFGTHEMELLPPVLVRRTGSSELSARLETLGPLVVTESHAFLYNSPVSAFVVPRHSVLVGDFDRFMEGLRNNVRGPNH